MRASWLLCIAVAHTGLCPQQQQQLGEEVSGWQPGLGLSVWSSCNRVHPTRGLWEEAMGKLSLMAHFPSHLNTMKATLATNVLGSAGPHFCHQLDSTAPCQRASSVSEKAVAVGITFPQRAAGDSKGKEVNWNCCSLAWRSPHNIQWKASFPWICRIWWVWAEASRRSPRSDQGHHRHKGSLIPPASLSSFQSGSKGWVSAWDSQADWVPLIPWSGESCQGKHGCLLVVPAYHSALPWGKLAYFQGNAQSHLLWLWRKTSWLLMGKFGIHNSGNSTAAFVP